MIKQALYPGSFDPITNGHIDIIKRAKNIVEKIHVAVFDYPFKKPFFKSLIESLRLKPLVIK